MNDKKTYPIIKVDDALYQGVRAEYIKTIRDTNLSEGIRREAQRRLANSGEWVELTEAEESPCVED